MISGRLKDKIPLLILAGPTAVGKSALALEIARRLNTDIITADSAQVYRGLDIGTAKPSPLEQRLVRHHLIDLVDPDQAFSVADYQKAADDAIHAMWQANKLPLMAGGTGLYIKAVTDRFAFGEKGPDPGLRAALEEIIETAGLEELYNRLKKVDPRAAEKIHPHDRKRIIRALEVHSLEGRPISEQEIRTGQRESPYRPVFYALSMDRETLYKRIEERVDRMIELGFLEEVRNLIRKGYDQSSPGLQILGYRQLLDYLRGETGWYQTVSEIKKQTRNLAKRQLTWFRREKGLEWIEIDHMSSFQDIVEIICKKVKDITP